MLTAAQKRKPPNAGKGRKKGVPNKLTGDLKDMILGALHAVGGQQYLQRQASKKNAAGFLKLVGQCLPKDIKIGTGLRLEVNLVGIDRSARDQLPPTGSGRQSIP